MRSEVDEDFARYVAARQHRFLRAAFLVCGDRDRAEDAVETAFARLAPRWTRVRAEDPDAYVRSHLYRLAVAAGRKGGDDPSPEPSVDRAADPEPAPDGEQAWRTDDAWGSDDAGFGDDSGWTTRTEWRDPAERVCDSRLPEALARLEPRERALVVIQFFEDRSAQEAAAALGLRVDTVATLTGVAVATLAERVPGLTAQEEHR